MPVPKQTSTQVIYRLPDLHEKWPFPRIMSFWHREVSPVSADWIESFGLFSEAHKRRFRKINCGLLASLAYPYHTKEELRPAADLMNVLFAVDDISDELTADEVKNLSDICLDALRNPDKPRPQGEHPVGQLHKDFMSQLKKNSSQTTLRRFIPSYERYLEAVLYEAADRESHIIRGSIDDYLALRRYTGAIKPSFDLILLPVEIPDEVLLDPRIVNLEMIAIDMVAVANDVVSFNVEQARGDIHNAVIVVMHQKGLSVQEAMDDVNEWYNQRGKDFLDAMLDLPECPSNAVREKLKWYVHGLGNWVTANYEWSFGSKRFFSSLNDTIKETGMMTLLPKEQTA
ncbi:hypothetical protein VKT23_015703 [Stygiomarasmius scandens]|uniref:Terpene synthase n=1 Tax=Marasmiellus scandens TaxID=2682957 RepID=A0ABR1IZB1_9AGAR